MFVTKFLASRRKVCCRAFSHNDQRQIRTEKVLVVVKRTKADKPTPVNYYRKLEIIDGVFFSSNVHAWLKIINKNLWKQII